MQKKKVIIHFGCTNERWQLTWKVFIHVCAYYYCSYVLMSVCQLRPEAQHYYDLPNAFHSNWLKIHAPLTMHWNSNIFNTLHFTVHSPFTVECVLWTSSVLWCVLWCVYCEVCTVKCVLWNVCMHQGGLLRMILWLMQYTCSSSTIQEVYRPCLYTCVQVVLPVSGSFSIFSTSLMKYVSMERILGIGAPWLASLSLIGHEWKEGGREGKNVKKRDHQNN